MKLHELKYTEGSKKDVTRVGRGMASGKGKTSTRGHKGQNSRSGGGVRVGFEGGQTPLYRRLPKIGFTSPNQKEYVILNLSDLERLNLALIDHKVLVEQKIIKNEKQLVKVLGKGSITSAINVKLNKVSKSAQAEIEKLGGKVEVI
ncbi:MULTISPECIES: 50S ribosomal protein L15 [Mesoplasma]|uniref:Large ribosomal subunit protein uL15 n=2 Tax=Mesoplasma florum TaxID=2151 RepID=RL15_MESFL|nr:MULTISPECIES: 50S ribosomal protein L15 [Mesoplasma]Q6F1X6.1 RecName: Full=Large ribosomal subunit protein uL15; AltName: Full=50S ribosomal protein L15 [Mesoplasma florum L1]AAT75497.1 50S ribosomal protein L15 [Mesoplasma florum L1]AGY41213.1 LSU ribosomal protein L15p (L27Ae) [Mesoplasma florum W37]ATI73096.1 50S ribosomal protein L15 [Mesoplasma florum]ATI73785.1 50S ribosomal protein L15 [Mesoplasma florum]AVN58751.1 50S ribosomal protein L15 [Mesoplasma florum]